MVVEVVVVVVVMVQGIHIRLKQIGVGGESSEGGRGEKEREGTKEGSRRC